MLGKLIDVNTMMFVAIHEMGHLSSETIGHNDEFWDNFKYKFYIRTNYESYQRKSDNQ